MCLVFLFVSRLILTFYIIYAIVYLETKYQSKPPAMKIYMTATFTMIPGLVEEFRTWMRDDFLKKISSEERAEGICGLTIDMTDPLKKLCYRLEFRSEQDLKVHQLYLAGAADTYFSQKWLAPMQQGNLTAMIVVGPEHQFRI